jgi:uncharacterized membrane protein YhdT
VRILAAFLVAAMLFYIAYFALNLYPSVKASVMSYVQLREYFTFDTSYLPLVFTIVIIATVAGMVATRRER